MAELTVQNVDVSKLMHIEGIHEKVDQFVEAMEENPVTKKLLDALETVEDAYRLAKEFIEIKWEDFKVLWDKTVDYFKTERAPLSDEVMDGVVGGWSLSGWWNQWKRTIAAACIMVGGAVGGAVLGACVGGPFGLFTGAFAGFLVGNACAHYYLKTEEEKDQQKK